MLSKEAEEKNRYSLNIHKENADYKFRTKYREDETLSPKAFGDIKIDVADVLPKERK